MADRVARAIRYMGREDFDLVGDNDRPALMELVEDYFCGDDPEESSSGKPWMGFTTIALQLYYLLFISHR